MYDITYSIHVTSDRLYLWHHIHYVWQHNTVCFWYDTQHMCDIICTRDDITSTLPHQITVFDVTSTSGMTSHPLYQTLHPLYLCHLNLSTYIIPTFVWHDTNYMCDNIYSLCNIISTPYVITLLYLWYHSLYIWNHIQYVEPHIHYTRDITAINLCHHSHSIDITNTLYDITLG